MSALEAVYWIAVLAFFGWLAALALAEYRARREPPHAAEIPWEVDVPLRVHRAGGVFDWEKDGGL